MGPKNAVTLLTAAVWLSGFASSGFTFDERPLGHAYQDIQQMSLKRQDAIKNLAVSYRVDYEFYTSAPTVRGRYVQKPYVMMFSLMGERRKATVEPDDKNDVDQTVIFDGAYTLKQRPAGIMVFPGKDRSCEDLERYCLSALQMPYRDKDRLDPKGKWFFPDVLRQSWLSGLTPYRLRDKAEEIDGAACVVLEHSNLDRVWIDPKIGGAIRRRERSQPDPDKSARQIETMLLKDYVKTPSGIWVPRRCEFTRYGLVIDPIELRNKPIMKEIITVNEIRINDLTEADFSFNLKPGTKIYTRDGDFVVPGNDQESLADFAKIVNKQMGRSSRWTPKLWMVVVVATMIGVACIAALSAIVANVKRPRPAVSAAAC